MSDIIDRFMAVYPEHHKFNYERLRAENEKLRSDVKTAVFADSAELKDVKRYNDELRGLLREAWVKMDANNLWSNLRARVAAALKETGDD